MPRARATTDDRASVARLLDPSVFREQHAPVLRPSRLARDAEPRFRKRQVVLDEAADTTLERLTEALRTATGTRLTTSHAVRALLASIAPSIADIAVHRAPVEATFLPNNAPRFAQDRLRFERAVSDLLRVAVFRAR